MTTTAARIGLLTTLCAAAPALARPTGIVGYSGQTAGTTCSACHTQAAVAAPTVTIAGPATLAAGTTGTYTLTVAGGPGVQAGLNVSKDAAGGALGGDGTTTQESAGEVTHIAPLDFTAGSAVFQFTLTAPGASGTVRLYGAGNSVDGALVTGDREGLTTFDVTVTGGNQAPTVATAAAAASATVTGTTVGLSVLGADDGGEAALTYTWAATGPAAPAFSANGTNAAKATTATFTRAGTYVFTVTLRDAAGATVTSQVSVVVQQVLASLTVTPATAGVATGATQQFGAAGRDQFAQSMTVAPTWSVSGGGTISTGGLFTAGATAGGPFTVTASGSGRTATAQVTVSAGSPPTIATAARAASNPITGTNVVLSVLGADDGGEAALTYTWTANAPPAPVTFNRNGSNLAKSVTATFTRAGTYAFTATARDAQGLTATSQVSVTVSATATRLAVSPSSVSVQANGAAQLSASATDQFNQPLATAPTVTWTSAGGGTISAAGLFRAGTATGGPFTVTATAGSLTATAQVTVTAQTGPTLAQQPTASPAVVQGNTTRLEVLADDGAGEAALTYAWAATGPAPVTFSASGNNVAKATVATFQQAGAYVVTVTVRNPSGETTSAQVDVTVEQVLAAVAVEPSRAVLDRLGTQQFTARLADQFGQPVADPPAVEWRVGGGGTIDASGAFTAQDATGGPWLVSAAVGGLRGTAGVSVGQGATVDNVPPEVAVHVPLDGETAQGPVLVRVDAVDAVGVATVEVFVDGRRAGNVYATPWELTLDTAKYPDGRHRIEAVATDRARNSAWSEAVEVVFENGVAGPRAVAQGETDLGCRAGPGGLAALLLGALAPALRRRSSRRPRP